jgi:nicotinamidase-related amidase
MSLISALIVSPQSSGAERRARFFHSVRDGVRASTQRRFRPMATAEIKGPAPGAAALVIIDMINDLDFEGGEALKPHAEAAAEVIGELRERAEALDAPVVYVNDNFGQWHSEQSRLVEHCLREGCAGREIVRRLAPRKNDYFVIKPQVSGFYATNLQVLLPKLGVTRLALTGVAADICVLFTAADAHMRAYELWTPADAVASGDPQRTQWALDVMRHSLGADIRPTTELSFDEWVAAGGRRPPGE